MAGHGDSVAAALMSVVDPAANLRPLNTVMPAREYLAAMWARRDFAIGGAGVVTTDRTRARG